MIGFVARLAPILLIATAETAPPAPRPHDPGRAAAKTTGQTSPAHTRDESSAKQTTRLTPEQETAATSFVQQHGPELAELLTYLKEHRPRQYGRAVADLFRTSQRLAGIRKRDRQRYQLELHAWQVKSHIELLAAQLRFDDSNTLRTDLRKSIEELLEIRKQLLTQERKRLGQRIHRLDSQIERLNSDWPSEVDRRLDAITNRTRKKSRTKKPAKQP